MIDAGELFLIIGSSGVMGLNGAADEANRAYWHGTLFVRLAPTTGATFAGLGFGAIKYNA